MNEDRRDAITIEILAALQLCLDGQCPVNILKNAVDLSLRPGSLGSEFAAALSHAEARGWIVGVRPPIGTVHWRLTPQGHGVLLTVRPA